MKISYTYAFDDYEAINLARQKHRRFARARDGFFWLLVIANLVLGIWFLWLVNDGRLPNDGAYLLNFGIAVLLLVGRYLGGPWYRKWYMRQQMIEGKQVELEFSDDGIDARLDTTTTHTKWAGVFRVDEVAEHYLAWINKLQAYSVPKRAFGPGEEDQFRALVLAHAPNRTFDI